MTAVALCCDWKGDWQDEIANLIWLILSPGINLSRCLQCPL